MKSNELIKYLPLYFNQEVEVRYTPYFIENMAALNIKKPKKETVFIKPDFLLGISQNLVKSIKFFWRDINTLTDEECKRLGFADKEDFKNKIGLELTVNEWVYTPQEFLAALQLNINLFNLPDEITITE